MPVHAAAEISLKKGGFMISARDIELKSAAGELQLRHTYNSFSPEPGWFGWSWGSLFKTRVIAMPDGTGVVRENGSGITRFYDSVGRAPASDIADTIVEAVNVRDKLTTTAGSALLKALQKTRKKCQT